MKPAIYANAVGRLNEHYIADIFNLTRNHTGIDLKNDTIGIEVKSRGAKYTYQVTIHADQITRFPAENPTLELFWCILFYNANQPSSTIINMQEIEQSITKRTTYFLPWSWIATQPIRETPKEKYVYLHQKQIPNEDYFSTHQRGKGTLHVPKESTLEQLLAAPQPIVKEYLLERIPP